MGKADGVSGHPILSRREAEKLVFREARLLDEDRFEEWLKLFTGDGIYSVPSDETADPAVETSIIHDDARQREKRVFQLRNRHLAQDPLSRTIHFVSNIEVEQAGAPDEVLVRCNALIAEMRPGDHQGLQRGLAEPRILPCRCVYRLRRENDEWRIASKQVLLIDRDLPLQNITFIL